jgi:metallo-beta-lactamase family protein
VEDFKKARGQLQGLAFDEVHEPLAGSGIRLRLHRAGHLLGAAHLEVSAKGSDGERRTWLFSGDVGRYGVPILKDPRAPQVAAEALLLESTYGDRVHKASEAAEQLGRIVEETYERGGKVIIPAFALGRTQEVLYYLAQLVDAGRLDPRTVFLDSPMAITATQIYDRAEQEHDEELKELVAGGEDPLSRNLFNHCRSVADSKRINERREPAVIVASSGMATAGRVVHHLMHWLGDERSAVVFTGYQAHGTRGRALLEGADSVAIHRRHFRVRARVSSLQGLSAHADREELLRWCRELPAAPSRVYLNHGEDPARKALEACLEEELGWRTVVLPHGGQSADW